MPKKAKLPEKLPLGLILKDSLKQEWKLGKSVGVGGFGEIYSASVVSSKYIDEKCEYVIKIEPLANGPLFTELHCYSDIGKPDQISHFIKSHKLPYLGVSRMFGCGSHNYNSSQYRFLVMQKFGKSVQNFLEETGNTLPSQTVINLGIKMVHVLEYMHSQGYTHGDVKGSNILLDIHDINKAYLVDFGLATKYMSDGVHKPLKFNKRCAHNGTIEYVSRDMHLGVPTRRSDLEILGYNLVHWSGGKLPWEGCLSSEEKVEDMKAKCMKNIPKFVGDCVKGNAALAAMLVDYLCYVDSLEFDSAPDYKCIVKILQKGLSKLKLPNDGKLVFQQVATKRKSKEAPRNPTPKKKPRKKSLEVQDSDVEMDENTNEEPKRPVKRRTAKEMKGGDNKTTAKAKKKPLTDNLKNIAYDNPTPQMLRIINKKIEKTEIHSENETDDTNNKKTVRVKKRNPVKKAAKKMVDSESSTDTEEEEEVEDRKKQPLLKQRMRVKDNKDIPTPQMMEVLNKKGSNKKSQPLASESSKFDNPTPFMKEVLQSIKAKQSKNKRK